MGVSPFVKVRVFIFFLNPDTPAPFTFTQELLRHRWKALTAPPPLAYAVLREFVETPTFTRLIAKFMGDDEHAKLQLGLALRPEWGKVIPGSGGLRKLRWAGSGRGKRGGLRIIYYWQTADDQIWLLLAYRKSERDDLSHDEIKQLKRLVEEFA